LITSTKATRVYRQLFPVNMTLEKSNSAVLKDITAALIIVVLLQVCPIAIAQTDTNFTPADSFHIPSHNTIISFAVNGTYANAKLRNDTWNFADLRLSGSQPLENLEVSAQDSNVTIVSYQVYNTTLSSARLRVVVEGRGKQTFNIGIDVEQGEWGVHPEWSVIVNGVWMGEGDGWSITLDGTLTITGLIGNVTIVHYGFLEAIGSENGAIQSFVQKHSVAIITTVIVAITVIIAIVIRVRNKKQLESRE
jgi:hypothetical protein